MRTLVEHENNSQSHRPGRYIAVQIAGRYYAIPSESVSEMMPVQELFPWRSEASGLEGMLLSRGVKIPVYDLASRLGDEKARVLRLTNLTRLIVVDVHTERAAFYADRLTDMIQARAHEIKNGTIYGHGRPKVILNLDSLWTREELAALAA